VGREIFEGGGVSPIFDISDSNERRHGDSQGERRKILKQNFSGKTRQSGPNEAVHGESYGPVPT